MSTDPAAEHVDAVARGLRAAGVEVGYVGGDRFRQEVARRLLTSTDPAVHAAMLDALVRAGVLEPTDEYGVRRESGDVGSVAPMRYRSEAVRVADSWNGTVVVRRHYVTPWEVAP